MPNKFSKILLSITIFCLFSNATVHAASLSLTHIGGLATSGAKYSEWWYTQTNPTLKGTASPSKSVSISIDGVSNSTIADSSGNWSHPTTMPKGDYKVVIASESESYSFTLHTEQNLPEMTTAQQTTTSKQSTSSVPVTGTNQVIGITLTVLLLLIGYHYFITAREKALTQFEKETISDK